MRKTIPKNAVLVPDRAKCAFNGVIYDVYQWEQQNFDDSVAVFEMLKRPDTVVAICLVDDKILVLDEEQPHSGPRLSLPGGRADNDGDESALHVAQREVKEETGYEFTSWRLVSVVQPAVKIEWFVHTYLAWGASRQGGFNHDPGEKIILQRKSFEDFKALIQKGIGYLGENRHIFDNLKSLNDLKNLPEFKGQNVDR